MRENAAFRMKGDGNWAENTELGILLNCEMEIVEVSCHPVRPGRRSPAASAPLSSTAELGTPQRDYSALGNAGQCEGGVMLDHSSFTPSNLSH